LCQLIEKMDESVEVYGVGGIGKTALIQLGLLIQKLKGKKIIAIGTRQSYLSGSGYKNFKDKCADQLYETIGGRVTLEDIALALGIQEALLGKEDPEKINIMLNNINKRNISLFLDDFHLSDDSIRTLVNQADCSVILASKRKIGLARNEIPLLGVEEEDRYNLIDLAARRFHKNLDSFAKDKIKNIAEGHPVSTEILVRNFEIINFKVLENFKKGLNISNPKHSEELLRREVEEILNDKALLLLKKLSVINTELKSNIRGDIVKVIIGNSSIPLLIELIDTGMLSKKLEREETYIFSYKHIQDILREDKKDFHRWALNYYLNKPLALGEGHADQIESLFHQSIIKPDLMVDAYLDLNQKTKPIQEGFKRLIEVGEQLKSYHKKNKQIKALILVNIANSYKELNKFEESRKAYREAITDYRELSREHRLFFKPHLSATLSNIGSLYRISRKFDDSEKAYLESLKIKRELANRDPDAFNPGYAQTLTRVGNLYSELKKFDDSERAYLESLKIQRELVNGDPDVFKPDYAITLSNIAILYSELKKFEDSENAYLEALKIQRELADKNPDVFKDDLAITLNNFAGLYKKQKKFKDSEKAFLESLKILKELADKNADAFKPDYALTLNNIAILYGDLKKFEDSEKAYLEALKIQRELADKNPDVFKYDLASTLNNIAGLYNEQKKL
jgi:tetratricopeptide (TPR) repeat protein